MENKTNFLIYKIEDGKTKIDVRLEGETVWMTQKAIGELYQKGVNTINKHIKNIYDEGELEEKRTIRQNRIVQNEGNRQVKRSVKFYNLEMIIAISFILYYYLSTHFLLETHQNHLFHVSLNDDDYTFHIHFEPILLLPHSIYFLHLSRFHAH